MNLEFARAIHPAVRRRISGGTEVTAREENEAIGERTMQWRPAWLLFSTLEKQSSLSLLDFVQLLVNQHRQKSQQKHS